MIPEECNLSSSLSLERDATGSSLEFDFFIIVGELVTVLRSGKEMVKVTSKP